ncbi:MAG: hypothetical protein ACYCT2_06970 [Thermoplasmataceae archaeon]
MTVTEGEMRGVIRAGLLAVAIPVMAFALALASANLLWIDYVHVLLGAIWTGVDVFLGLIFAFVIRTLDSDTRKNVAFRILPMTLFFIPAASILTPAAGYVLAVNDGIFSLSSPIIDIILVVGGMLFATGFATIVPYSWQILREMRKETVNGERVSACLAMISGGALAQMIFQIAIISLMAYMVVYP